MLKKKIEKKPEIKPAITEPVKSIEIPVGNIPTVTPISAAPETKQIILESGGNFTVKVETKKASDHEMFNMLIADIKNLMPTDEEKRRMKQQLNYVCPESRDLLTTIVKILSRF